MSRLAQGLRRGLWLALLLGLAWVVALPVSAGAAPSSPAAQTLPAAPGTAHDHHRLIVEISLGAALLLLAAISWALLMRVALRRAERARRALKDQLGLMHALVEGTPHPVYIRDRDGLLQSCNDSYLDAIGTQRHTVLGKPVNAGPLGDTLEAERFAEDYRQVMTQAQPMIVDRTVVLGDRTLTIYHWVVPYHDALGDVCGVVGGWVDISDRRQLCDDLRAARDRADAANRAKSAFLTTMSHEIRTPLSAVIGLLELALERAEQGRPDRDGLQVAHTSARGLMELVGDILDIARIESGHLILHPIQVNPATLVTSAVRVFEGVARQKDLHLRLDITAPGRHFDVVLDPVRFRQVLSNLLSNAIKFTEQGQVTVSLDLAGGGAPELRLSVRDTGIGISQADHDRLFRPFVQAQASARISPRGTGLGLVICESLCQAMGATLRLDSTLGQGTEAHVTLPVERLPPCAPSGPAACPRPALNPGLRVLVIDDNPANRLLTAQQLEHLAARTTLAADAREGLAHWRGQAPDVVLLDCNLPDMSGPALCRTLREEEHQGQRARCTVLGYTANAQPQERERCLAAGMDDCLFKPLDLDALARALQGVQVTCAPVLRLDALLPLTGGDAQQDLRLLRQVRRSCADDLAALEALAPQGPEDELSALAHKVLGAARIVDAVSVCAACRAIADPEDGAPPLSDRRERLLRELHALTQAIDATIQGLEHRGATLDKA